MPWEYEDWTRRREPKTGRPYRSRLAITVDMLYVCLNYVERLGSKKSPFVVSGIDSQSLMYGANINYNQMKFHSKELLIYGLIAFDNVSNSYKISSKGRDFLKQYEVLKTMLPSIDKASKDDHE